MTSAELRRRVLAEYRQARRLVKTPAEALLVVYNRYAHRVAMAVSVGRKPYPQDVLLYDICGEYWHSLIRRPDYWMNRQ